MTKIDPVTMIMDRIQTAYMLTANPLATAQSAQMTAEWLRNELSRILDTVYADGAEQGMITTLHTLRKMGYLDDDDVVY